jgi:fructokinase
LPEAICLGEILMDMLPDKKGVTWSEISSFSPVPGGAPANVCVGLAKLGVRAGFIGKVGEDPFGKLLVDALQENGVDVSQVKFDAGVRTTLGFVFIGRQGENDFFFYRNPGADTMLYPEELDEDFIARSKVFHFGSISMTTEPSCSATLRAIQFARKHKVIISFDPNLRPHLWKDLEEAKEKIMEGLKSADLVKVNDAELEFITGTVDLVKGANWLIQRGPKIVVITRGEKGSFFHNKEGFDSLPAYKVKVVDTVGCGDAFTAAILQQFFLLDKEGRDISCVSKREMKKILRFANAAGALTATKKGVIPSLPTRKQIEEFLDKLIATEYLRG